MTHVMAGNPWLTIWKQPRATIRHLIKTNQVQGVLLISAMWGICRVLQGGASREVAGDYPLYLILVFAIGGGALVGIFGLFVFSALITWTGRWFGGKASPRDVRTAFAWAHVPSAALLAVWIIALLLFGSDLFSVSNGGSGLSLVRFFLSAVSIIVFGWSLGLMIVGVGEVQKFSDITAVWNIVVAGLIFMAVTLLVALPIILLG